MFFRHERVGRGGRLFQCWKFRSMAQDPETVLQQHLMDDPQAALEWALTHKLRHDPRIAPVGRFLMASSLDELPQL